MASYTLLWTNDTWDKYSNVVRTLGSCPIDYVAGDNKRPLSEILPKDEFFIVTVKQGSLYVAGRLVVAALPMNKHEASRKLGRSDLIDKALFFIANKDEIDMFRSACLVDLEIAKKLELIRVDRTIGHPSLDRHGAIDRQAFRSPFKLTAKSADTLRSILAHSSVPLRAVQTVAAQVADISLASNEHRNDIAPGGEQGGGSGSEYSAAGVNYADPEPLWDEIVKDIDKECANLAGADVDAIIKRRVGQGIFRSRLMDQFDGSCCMTGLTNTRLLIASHIVPWSESGAVQKLDPENGLLLSVAMDALFDKGLISFSENGKMLVEKDLDAETLEILGLECDFSLPAKLLTDARKGNLAEHRKLHAFDISPI